MSCVHQAISLPQNPVDSPALNVENGRPGECEGASERPTAARRVAAPGVRPFYGRLSMLLHEMH
jgi:hypothetical protein